MRSALLMSVLFAGLAQAAVHSVVISPSSKFTPNHIVIKAGDAVEFSNNSTFRHTVTADPSLAKDPANVILPAGAEPFHGVLEKVNTFSPNKTFTHVFTVPGLYQYVCLPHEAHGMKGQVEVLAADVVEEEAEY